MGRLLQEETFFYDDTYQEREDKDFTRVKVLDDPDECVCPKVCMISKIDGQPLTPIVDKVEYDSEHDVFAIEDKVKINDFMYIDVYFYVKTDGEPLGLIYNNYLEQMGAFNVQNCTLEEAYLAYKENIALYINEHMEERIKRHKKNNDSFLHLIKRND